MKFIVLSGSPKGAKSVTLQYIRYIENAFPQHELKVIHVTRRIRRLERDRSAFDAVMREIGQADGIFWATPVYYLLVPAGYKRFIELIVENGAQATLLDKPAAILTTSVHFYDHTAHNYLHAICDDLEMRCLGHFSADMYDLLKAAERKRLETFATLFFSEVAGNGPPPKRFVPLSRLEFRYRPGKRVESVYSGQHKVLMVIDAINPDSNLDRMHQYLKRCFNGSLDLIDLGALDIKGGCLGCLQCAYDNTCTYAGKDAFNAVYRDRIMRADILIWAGEMTDRYLSSKWKQFFDRSFFMGHTPSLSGKQVGMIISGPLGQNANLRQIIEAYMEMQGASLVGIVTDETGNSAVIDAQLTALARRLIRHADQQFVAPATFLGRAGTILFRDEIWGRLRFPFRADYGHYRRLGLFDFPQHHWPSRLRNALLLFLSRFPGLRHKINQRMKDEMIKPLQKYLRTQ
ncbi:flavodoxin [Desulfosarcina ovata subsp. sediminis]|uniref:Flavodoxin n=1 Tax=Desulfosarcina ovata subsp. sediminis TaxID=885957 RepID=A0A5K7ZR82_9BACT|nr:NAD(P)H-dependent oxidoreductase [Desulfosarcina ovata]BBO82920.1 flavodoxin [Desulfosarcina ovata subsp. sediminis]